MLERGRVEPEHLLRSAACTVGAQKVTTDKRQARSLSGPGEQRVQSVQTEFQWRTHGLLRLDFPGLFDIRLVKGNIHGTNGSSIVHPLVCVPHYCMPPVPAPCLLWGVWGEWSCDDRKEVERSGFGIPFPIIGILLLLLHPLPGGGDGRVQSGALERTKKKKKVSQEGERTQIRPRPRERDGGGEENKALFGVVYRENAMEYGWQRDVGKKRLRAPRCTHSASASLWAPHEKRRRRRGPDLEGASPTNM